MERNNELQEIDFKNRTCHCFDDIANINDLDPDIILLYEKSYKVPFGAKPLHNVFDKVDRYIKTHEKLNISHFSILMKNIRC